MVLWLLCLSATIGCRGPRTEAHRALDPVDQLKENGVEPKTLIIGVPPAVGSSAMEKRVGPLADYLESSLNVKVKIRGASSYRELIASLRNKELHAAILSPLSYVQARKSLPVVPVASASSGGSPTYVGYFVVAADSPFRSLEQLRGARVAWVDHGSTSGYLYPRAMMR